MSDRQHKRGEALAVAQFNVQVIRRIEDKWSEARPTTVEARTRKAALSRLDQLVDQGLIRRADVLALAESELAHA